MAYWATAMKCSAWVGHREGRLRRCSRTAVWSGYCKQHFPKES